MPTTKIQIFLVSKHKCIQRQLKFNQDAFIFAMRTTYFSHKIRQFKLKQPITYMHLTCDLQNLRCIHALNDILLTCNPNVFESLSSLFDICNQIKTKATKTTSDKNYQAYSVDRLPCMVIVLKITLKHNSQPNMPLVIQTEASDNVAFSQDNMDLLQAIVRIEN